MPERELWRVTRTWEAAGRDPGDGRIVGKWPRSAATWGGRGKGTALLPSAATDRSYRQTVNGLLSPHGRMQKKAPPVGIDGAVVSVGRILTLPVEYCTNQSRRERWRQIGKAISV